MVVRLFSISLMCEKVVGFLCVFDLFVLFLGLFFLVVLLVCLL